VLQFLTAHPAADKVHDAEHVFGFASGIDHGKKTAPRLTQEKDRSLLDERQRSAKRNRGLEVLNCFVDTLADVDNLPRAARAIGCLP